MADALKIIQITGSGGILISSLLVFLVMVVHITRRLTHWETTFEGRFNRIEVKLGLRDANGDSERYGKVVTVGDLMAFEDRQNKQVEAKIKECRTQQGVCHV